MEIQFNFEDSPRTEIGFFSVWKGKSHNCAPITFESSNSKILGMGDFFDNSLGDYCRVIKETTSIAEVSEFISNNKIVFINK